MINNLLIQKKVKTDQKHQKTTYIYKIRVTEVPLDSLVRQNNKTPAAPTLRIQVEYSEDAIFAEQPFGFIEEFLVI